MLCQKEDRGDKSQGAHTGKDCGVEGTPMKKERKDEAGEQLTAVASSYKSHG